jgi:hypothetical protein
MEDCMMRHLLAILVLTFVGMAQAQLFYDEAEQRRLKKMWPKELDFPQGLKFYKPARHAQRISITNNRDTVLPWPTWEDDALWGQNPNRLFPFAVAGGLHNVSGWKSTLGVKIPKEGKIVVWKQRVLADTTPLVKVCWQFEGDFAFYDLLTKHGQAFEVRLQEKRHGKWHYSVPFKDARNQPEGYQGAGSCVTCHRKAGSTPGYAFSWRGDDEVPSLPVLREGTIEPDMDLPIEMKREGD